VHEIVMGIDDERELTQQMRPEMLHGVWKSLFADVPMRSDLGPHPHDPPPH